MPDDLRGDALQVLAAKSAGALEFELPLIVNGDNAEQAVSRQVDRTLHPAVKPVLLFIGRVYLKCVGFLLRNEPQQTLSLANRYLECSHGMLFIKNRNGRRLLYTALGLTSLHQHHRYVIPNRRAYISIFGSSAAS
jgi:hypothetical protein